jgi:hypothetical protein
VVCPRESVSKSGHPQVVPTACARAPCGTNVDVLAAATASGQAIATLLEAEPRSARREGVTAVAPQSFVARSLGRSCQRGRCGPAGGRCRGPRPRPSANRSLRQSNVVGLLSRLPRSATGGFDRISRLSPTGWLPGKRSSHELG